MPLKAPKTSSSRQMPEEKVHTALITSVVDIGSHYDDNYEKFKREIVVSLEFPNFIIKINNEDGTESEFTYVKSRMYTLSMHKKSNLRALVQQIIGKELSDDEAYEYDIFKIVGKPCMTSVVHKQVGDKTYANISTVMPLPDGFPPPKPVREQFTYSIDESPKSVPEEVPEWMKELIVSSKEWEDADDLPL